MIGANASNVYYDHNKRIDKIVEQNRFYKIPGLKL